MADTLRAKVLQVIASQAQQHVGSMASAPEADAAE